MLHIRLCCTLHDLRPHNAREPRPGPDNECEQKPRDTGTDKARHRHHETDARDPLKDIAHRCQHIIYPSAEVSRKHAHNRSDTKREHRRDERQQERTAPAVEHTAEEIAPAVGPCRRIAIFGSNGFISASCGAKIPESTMHASTMRAAAPVYRSITAHLPTRCADPCARAQYPRRLSRPHRSPRGTAHSPAAADSRGSGSPQVQASRSPGAQRPSPQ